MIEDHDEGFISNLHRVFGPGSDYDGMGGKPLASVKLNEDSSEITFAFQDGSSARFGVEGDCCSRSWIEHLTVPDDIAGAELVSVEDARIDRIEKSEFEYLQVYKTHFKTAKGDIILEYRNSSNGYYGGYLVRLRG